MTWGQRWTAHLMSWWLAGLFLAQVSMAAFFPDRPVVQQLGLLAAVLWPLGWFLLGPVRFAPRGIGLDRLIALSGFLLFAFLSAINSLSPYLTLTYAALTGLALLLCLQFNAAVSRDQLPEVFARFALLTTPILLVFAWLVHVPGERLGHHSDVLNPNATALVACSAAIAAVAIPGWVTRWVVFAAMGFVIYLTGSRTSLGIFLMFIPAYYFLKNFRIRTRHVILLLFLAAFLLAISPILIQAVLEFLNLFFALNDPDRGLNSGFTGRIYAWQEAWAVFLEHPALGVGFRTHGEWMVMATSAHNGYLAMLAEVGLFGFTCALFLVLGGLKARVLALGRAPEERGLAALQLTLILSYAVLAIFERFFFNVGNPYSILFMLAVLPMLERR